MYEKSNDIYASLKHLHATVFVDTNSNPLDPPHPRFLAKIKENGKYRGGGSENKEEKAMWKENIT